MSVIYVLLAISITVALVFFVAFVLSVRSGQYDDAYTPSVRMLFEDELLDQESNLDTDKAEITQTKRTNQ
ncbi:cbb3-type cytochrome oxidase assembly protein CcoS [Flagellimonas algicola]|uniref:Cbb3-type cytochrome oxidase assembly protein CcoS n=1 Tax=Flagellimonas algicola TaxID=2583815 RepID=A0ABY2WI10_9FLAO|nr:cbb3-type cytochrome oxidase assembly protein CcoS [Allomuricauda algicola]TMU54460.1 cbb3-type cytochrome oxidase assembly protein CcoS [Allomuricauda algicola]